MNNEFLMAYRQQISSCLSNNFKDNWDVYRFGPEKIQPSKGIRYEVIQLIKNLLSTVGLYEQKRETVAQKAEAFIGPNVKNLQWLYQNLADDESRNLLVQVQLYRALGAKHVKLPLNNKDYWSKLETVEQLMAGAETIDLGFMGWKAYKMKLDSLGYPFQLFLRPPGVLTQLMLQQYRCQMADKAIEVVEGDIVIDGGGCYGETALYFALKAGSAGQVFTFEFMPENLSIFHRNMALNPDVARRIYLIEKPLWEHSGEKLYIEGSGPGTRVSQKSSEPNARQIETISIDDLVREKKLAKIDFIKMDIEGAELHALKGAEQSIRKYRPKLAISIYHKPEDFWTIPQYIAGLDLGYRFALRHFTIHQEETVLFAF